LLHAERAVAGESAAFRARGIASAPRAETASGAKRRRAAAACAFPFIESNREDFGARGASERREDPNAPDKTACRLSPEAYSESPPVSFAPAAAMSGAADVVISATAARVVSRGDWGRTGAVRAAEFRGVLSGVALSIAVGTILDDAGIVRGTIARTVAASACGASVKAGASAGRFDPETEGALSARGTEREEEWAAVGAEAGVGPV